MKKTALTAALLVFASALLLSSCDAMFNTNLFKAAGLGQFSLANADLTTSSGVQEAAASSPTTFYDQLAADPASMATAISTLEASGTPSDLVLAAAIQINTTDAGTVVDNIASQLPTLMSSTTSVTASTLSSAISAILPATIDLTSPTTPTDFSTMVSAFLSASTNITSVVSSGVALPAVPGGTSQDTAYIGLVSLAVSAVQPTDSSGTVISNPSSTQIADALWNSIYNPSATPTFKVDTTNTLSMTSGSAAYDLLTAAGLGTTISAF